MSSFGVGATPVIPIVHILPQQEKSIEYQWILLTLITVYPHQHRSHQTSYSK